jgi:hypothetical protein
MTWIDIQQLQAEEEGSISAGLASMCTYYGYELWNNEKFDLAHKIYMKALELDPSPLTTLNVAVSTKEYLKDNKKFLDMLLKAEGIESNRHPFFPVSRFPISPVPPVSPFLLFLPFSHFLPFPHFSTPSPFSHISRFPIGNFCLMLHRTRIKINHERGFAASLQSSFPS